MENEKEINGVEELSNELKIYTRMMQDASDYVSSREFQDGGEAEDIKAKELKDKVDSKGAEILGLIRSLQNKMNIFNVQFEIVRDIQKSRSEDMWGFYLKRMKKAGLQ